MMELPPNPPRFFPSVPETPLPAQGLTEKDVRRIAREETERYFNETVQRIEELLKRLPLSEKE